MEYFEFFTCVVSDCETCTRTRIGPHLKLILVEITTLFFLKIFDERTPLSMVRC